MSVTITAADVAQWVGRSAGGDDTATLDPIAAAASATANQLVADRGDLVPASVLRLAALDIASNLYERRHAPNGVRPFGPEGVGVYVRADDTTSARRLLAPYLPPVVV